MGILRVVETAPSARRALLFRVERGRHGDVPERSLKLDRIESGTGTGPVLGRGARGSGRAASRASRGSRRRGTPRGREHAACSLRPARRHSRPPRRDRRCRKTTRPFFRLLSGAGRARRRYSPTADAHRRGSVAAVPLGARSTRGRSLRSRARAGALVRPLPRERRRRPAVGRRHHDAPSVATAGSSRSALSAAKIASMRRNPSTPRAYLHTAASQNFLRLCDQHPTSVGGGPRPSSGGIPFGGIRSPRVRRTKGPRHSDSGEDYAMVVGSNEGCG